jgi:cytochrome c
VIVTGETQKPPAGGSARCFDASQGIRGQVGICFAENPEEPKDPMQGFTLRTLMALAALVLPLFAAGSGAAQALDPEQARAKAMLQNLCGRCHAVGKVGKSPNPLAPPFRRFGEKLYDTDMVQRLQDGLTTIHPDMPTFRFNRHEAAAAVNYLRSIQKSR